MKSLWRKLLRVVWIPVACALIAGLVASVGISDATKEYRAGLLLVVPSTQVNDDGTVDDETITTIDPSPATTVDPIGRPTEAQRLAGSYAELVPNDLALLETVSAAVDLPTGEVRAGITATAIAGSSLLRITFTAPTEQQAEDAIEVTRAYLTGDAPGNAAFAPNSLVLASTEEASAVAGRAGLVVPAAMVLGLLFGGFLAVVWTRAVPRVDGASDLDGIVDVPIVITRRGTQSAVFEAIVRARLRQFADPPARVGVLGVTRRSGAVADRLAGGLLEGTNEAGTATGWPADVVSAASGGWMGSPDGMESLFGSDAVVVVIIVGEKVAAAKAAIEALEHAEAPVMAVLLVQHTTTSPYDQPGSQGQAEDVLDEGVATGGDAHDDEPPSAASEPSGRIGRPTANT